jgi:hypothetical protein
LEVDASEDFQLEEGTVSFWVKMNDSSSNWMFSRDQDGCQGDCGHFSIAHDSFIAEDKLGFRLQNDGGGRTVYALTENQSMESFESGEWNHVAVSFGNKGMKLYINDKLHDSNQHTKGITGNNLSTVIGSRYDGERGLNGKMDEVKIHNYQLNRTEIAGLTAAK